MDLEKLGVPTVTVCTEAFQGLAKEESRTLGMPGLPLAIIKHPLGGESKEAVSQRAQAALDAVIHGLTQAPR
ncbi:MAG TPA: hypothetical protein VL359_14845 [bacterium]|nr:hypothetical protein [bacterium]